MRSNTITRAVSWFLKNQHKIGTDEAFERPFGCWTALQKNQFIIALLSGFVCGAYVVAKTHDCATYSKEIGDESSYKWFMELYNRGIEFISLDSKHRRETMMEFHNDKFAVNGNVDDAEGVKVLLKNKKFSELPPALQQKFLNELLNLTIYEKATRKELAKIFIAVNSGTPLTPQHLRNALDTPIAKIIRDLMVILNKSGYEANIYSPKQAAEMKAHEDVAKIYMHCVSESGTISKGTLNQLYSKGEKEGLNGIFGKVYDKHAFSNTKKICKAILNLSKVSKRKLTPGDIMLYVLVLNRAFNAGYNISNFKTFLAEVFLLDESLDRTSHAKFARSSKDKSEFYWEWKRNNWGTARKLRADELWDEIISNPSNYGLFKAKKAGLHKLPSAAHSQPAIP
jgi:hypothetical protein